MPPTRLDPPFPSPQACYLQCARRHTSLSSLFYRYRRAFTLDRVPEAALLRLTGCSQYALYVNGRQINRGPLVSGKQMMTVDVFDISAALQSGRNVVAIHLIFYPVGHYRLDLPNWQGAGVVADLIMDGKVAWVSDEQWKADIDRAYEPNTSRRNHWMPLLEIYDARHAEDWLRADYDDSHWPAARSAGAGVPGMLHYEPRPDAGFEFEFDDDFAVQDNGHVTFTSRPDDFYWFADHELYQKKTGRSPLAIGSRLEETIIRLDPEYFTHVRLAAASYVLGRPSLTITAPAGAVIDFVWGERMRNSDTLLDPMALMSNWARLICKEGRQTFTFWSIIGFKQLQLIIHPRADASPVTIHRVGAQRQWTIRCDQGQFACDDGRFRRLWQAGAHTAACVTTDHHGDNAFREQQPWSGDQEWTKMGVYVSQGIHPITERQYLQLALGQKEDGRLVSPYPSAQPFDRNDKPGSLYEDLPDHAAGYIHSLWRHYLYSGNVELIGKLWPSLLRQQAYWNRHRDHTGLVDLKQLTNSWCWVDWLGLRDKAAPLNGLIGCALWAMIQLAQALGEDTTPHRECWQAHRQAFIDAFWSDEENLFVDHPLHRPELPATRSQLSNALAACARMLPDSADKPKLAQVITTLDGTVGLCSPPMAGWVFLALEALDAETLVHKLIEEQWLLPEIIDEMGTVPEFWPGTPGRSVRSLAQGGSPFISWALTHFVLGVRPSKPGFAEFIVKPVPGKLTSCSGVIPTIHGPLSVEWHKEGGVVAVKVKQPDGCRRAENASVIF